MLCAFDTFRCLSYITSSLMLIQFHTACLQSTFSSVFLDFLYPINNVANDFAYSGNLMTPKFRKTCVSACVSVPFVLPASPVSTWFNFIYFQPRVFIFILLTSVYAYFFSTSLFF